MFYEDVYDALQKTVSGNPQGLAMKQVASALWPTRNPETARSVLSRALNPENNEVKLGPEEIEKVMELCGPEHVIFYLCDKFGFERPHKKRDLTLEEEVQYLRTVIDKHNLGSLFQR